MVGFDPTLMAAVAEAGVSSLILDAVYRCQPTPGRMNRPSKRVWLFKALRHSCHQFGKSKL